jgi:hypothetical protein
LILKWLVLTLQKGAWAPLGVFGLHVVLAFGFNIYIAYPVLDIPMHFLGGIVIAYFFWQSLCSALKLNLAGQPSPLLQAVLIVALTGLATIFWEFAEWSWDFLFDASAQGGLDDTMLDMLMGLLGGSLFVSGVLIFGSFPGKVKSHKKIQQ